ncbi:hypothetical protein OH77DRAFT_1416268 [Trametes cingulata]|nr:hypothetical protein OH77DRAFT_1416268 [Trametes cingulata]
MLRWSRRYLLPRKSARDQSPQQWRKFIEKLVRDVPDFTKYEDEWPAKAYMTIRSKIDRLTWMKSAGRAAVRTHARREPSIAPSTRRTYQTRSGRSVRAPSRAPPPSTPATRVSTRSSQASSPATLVDPSQRSTSQHLRQTAQTSSASGGSRAVAVLAPVRSAVASRATGGSTPSSVRRFLRSLAQPLDFLLPVLAEIGLRDTTDLQGLAKLSRAESWLYRKLVVTRKITELQLQYIMEGLYRIPEEIIEVDDN